MERLHAVIYGDVQGVGFRYFLMRRGRELGLLGWVRNNDDGTVWLQGGSVSLDRRYTFQFDPSVSVRGNLLGKHEAKFGMQARVISHTYDFNYPGNRSFTDAGGGPGDEHGREGHGRLRQQQGTAARAGVK